MVFAESPDQCTLLITAVGENSFALMFTLVKSDFFLGLRSTTLGFYGNDGVCVFKYLVTQSDPQRVFTITLVVVNAICFIFIGVSYLAIAIATRKSARHVQNTNRNQGALQKKVLAIILTDFFCWIPLCTVSLLHFFEVFDADMWYPIFSIMILPINSVINPLLYDTFVVRMVPRIINSVRAGGARVVSAIWSEQNNGTEAIEMGPIQVRTGNN